MEHLILNETELPAIINLGDMDQQAFVAYYLENQSQIEAQLSKHGALKFDGIRIDTSDQFRFVIESIAKDFLNYTDGTSPRTKVSGHVYTSTEYNKSLKITMHNELSYSSAWPGKLYFCCLQPAETGGETLLADSRRILNELPADIVAAVESKGVKYVRNLHGGDNVGISWQQAFETQDKKELEQYCINSGIAYEWRENDAIQLTQSSLGIIAHPLTGEKVWFNQIDQFHPYQLGKDVYEAMMAVYDCPEDLPTYVKYGDDSAIEDEVVREILSTVEKLTIAPVWGKNELLLVDNVLACHGRNPYSGERQVLVSMTE